MSAKSLSGWPVGFTAMPFIIVFIEAANALSAELGAGFMAMPFMSSAPTVCANERNANATSAEINMDLFIMLSFWRERRLRGGGHHAGGLINLRPQSSVDRQPVCAFDGCR